MTWTEAQLTTYLKVVKALGYFDPIAVWRALAGTKNQSQCRKHCNPPLLLSLPSAKCHARLISFTGCSPLWTELYY